MQFDQTEFTTLTEKLESYASQVSSLQTRIELEPELAKRDQIIEDYKKRLSAAEERVLAAEQQLATVTAERDEFKQMAMAKAVENAWLKNCLLISVSGIKNFMHMIKRIELKALFLTFLQKTILPEMGAKGLAAINDAIEIKDEDEIKKLADQLIVGNQGTVNHD